MYRAPRYFIQLCKIQYLLTTKERFGRKIAAFWRPKKGEIKTY